LGEHQNNCFVAVKCGRGQLAKFTYVLTKSGLLCQFNQSRELEKFTDIKSGKASCLEIHSDYVMCGCNDGIIRLFDPITLDYITTAPRPHSLGVSLLSTLHLTEFISTPGHCPDTVALSYDIINNKLIVAYNDHSLYMWDLTNIDTIGKSHSFLYHNACVWDIAVYPLVSEVNDNGGLLPPLSFATCSSDNTIRFWNLTTPSDDGNGMKQRMKNVYSKVREREVGVVLYHCYLV
jgi:WD40 repeat protein